MPADDYDYLDQLRNQHDATHDRMRVALHRIASVSPARYLTSGRFCSCACCAALINEARSAIGQAPLPTAYEKPAALDANSAGVLRG